MRGGKQAAARGANAIRARSSRFAITFAAFAGTGSCCNGRRKFRVLRLAIPGFESCENIGLALPGASPVQSFFDTLLMPVQAA